VQCCCLTLHAEDARSLTLLNLAASLPTLERGQAIRGHYRAAGDELVIHARPCLALLYFYLGALPHVQHLRILGAMYLWLSTSRSISRRQMQRGFLAMYAASCRRHAQHATLPVPRALNRLYLCMVAQCVSCLTYTRLTAAHTDKYVLPAAVDVHKRLNIDTLYTSAAVALLAKLLPSMRQARIHAVAAIAPCWHPSVT
jgi:hypothetical protein